MDARLSRPAKYCAIPRCPYKATTKGYCPSHAQQQRTQDTRFQKGFYGRPWRRAVHAWLQEDPSRILCVDCRNEGRVTIGTETDHRIPHRGDPDLFWDRTNWQRLCQTHHSAKTAREVGWGAAK